jgi:hypothetical protein
MCRGRRARILLHLHIQLEGTVHPKLVVVSARTNKSHHHHAREPNWLAFWLQKPSIQLACVREEDVRVCGVHNVLFVFKYYSTVCTYYKAVRLCVCVFITAGSSTKLFACGGGGMWEDMCYERRRAEACEG